MALGCCVYCCQCHVRCCPGGVILGTPKELLCLFPLLQPRVIRRLAEPMYQPPKSTITPLRPINRYILLPTLGIGKTRIYPVGVTQQNMLDTPRNINDAAWYKSASWHRLRRCFLSMLIVAAYQDGVFVNLGILKNDDIIKIERGDGKELNYKVVENQTMSLEEATTTGMK